MKRTRTGYLMTAAVLCCASVAAADFEVKQLRCEYLRDPLGIDVARPRLSWIVESDQRGQHQTAYRVLVAARGAPPGECRFRRAFTLPADRNVARAVCFFSADNAYELWVNGKKADRGSNFHRAGESDVTGLLEPGANVLAVAATNAGDSDNRAGLVGVLIVEFDQGDPLVVATDRQWKVVDGDPPDWKAAGFDGGPIRANNDYDGEEYDARLEMPGWSEPGFDDSAWRAAASVDASVDAPAGRLAAQINEPMRVTETLDPVAMTEPEPGVYVYDMGENIVGWVRLAVRGERGDQVTLRHAETLDERGMLYTQNLRSARATDTYVLRGDGEEVYEPRFSYHGFRFVELRGYRGTPTRETIAGRVVHSDVAPAGSFAGSHPLVNRIVKNVIRGVRGNYLSIPTDCPQRDERQGWLGDPAARSKGESYMFGVAAFYRKWLTDMQDAQNDEGCVPDVAPAFWPFYSANVTWPSAYLLVPDWFYDQYGDARLLDEHYESMKRWIAFMSPFAKGDLVIWLYEGLAGIQSDPARPGFKHVVMRPQPVEGLEFVEARHRSPYGLIESRWRRERGALHWDVTVPAGATATVHVPKLGSPSPTVTEGGQPAAEAPGLRFVRDEGNCVVYETASDKYSFVVRPAESRSGPGDQQATQRRGDRR